MRVAGLPRLYRNRRFPLVAYFLSISSQPSTSVALQQQNSSSFLQSRQISQRSGFPSKLNSIQPPLSNTKMAFSTWNEDHQHHAMTRCVLPLSADSHKGSSGRVGVLGGSARYTGAPYYAAMAALKAGSDLAFVFCAQEASLPIKCYSPELMVAPVYSATDFDRLVENNQKETEEGELLMNRMVQEVTSQMDRLHVLVIGPGLGRCPMVLEATFRIIQEAKSRNIPLVLDADALFLLTLEPYQKALENYDTVVLTPNVVERKRLNGLEQYWKGATVIQKGAQDAICRDEKILATCAEEGGLKRSGGLGDILAGTIGTLVAWNSILTNQGKASSSDLPLACWTACCFTKRATKRAYDSHLRAMTAPDVLAELGSTINDMTSTSSKL